MGRMMEKILSSWARLTKSRAVDTKVQFGVEMPDLIRATWVAHAGAGLKPSGKPEQVLEGGEVSVITIGVAVFLTDALSTDLFHIIWSRSWTTLA
jgi:hypothetical protein